MSSNNYELLKNEITECVYCCSRINLYYINKHLKGKRCKTFQNLYFESNPDKKESDFLLFINELKKTAKYGETENETDEIE
jgi:hypothetical protein